MPPRKNLLTKRADLAVVDVANGSWRVGIDDTDG
jgi:hypothetical protein